MSQAFNIQFAGVDGERTKTGRRSSASYAHFDAASSAHLDQSNPAHICILNNKIKVDLKATFFLSLTKHLYNNEVCLNCILGLEPESLGESLLHPLWHYRGVLDSPLTCLSSFTK